MSSLEDNLHGSGKRLLVYIPCHSDFSLAIEQGERIRSQISFDSKDLLKFFDETKLVVSVNGYVPKESEVEKAKSIFDEVILYGSTLLADYNLALGYLKSVNLAADFLWILSTNDTVTANSISTIGRTFESSPDSQLVVLNSLGETSSYSELNVTNPPKIGYWYGLISGVVYRTEILEKYFNAALFLGWTGWSHLSVLQSAMNGENGIRVSTIPDILIFEQGTRDTNYDHQKYFHSYFGEVPLGFFSSRDTRVAKSGLRRFVFKNLFLHHLYNSRDKRNVYYPIVSNEEYGWWNREITESILKKNVPYSYLAYSAFRHVPFEKVKDFRLAKWIYQKIFKV
jgi:hypothetical protein